MSAVLVTLIFACIVINVQATDNCQKWYQDWKCPQGSYKPFTKDLIEKNYYEKRCNFKTDQSPACVDKCCIKQTKEICNISISSNSTADTATSYCSEIITTIKKNATKYKKDFQKELETTCESKYFENFYMDEICSECEKCQKKKKRLLTNYNEKRHNLNRTKSEKNLINQKSLNRIQSEQILFSDEFLPSWARDLNKKTYDTDLDDLVNLKTKNIYGMNQHYQQTMMNMNQTQPTVSQQFIQSNSNQSSELKNETQTFTTYDESLLMNNHYVTVQTGMHPTTDSELYQQSDEYKNRRKEWKENKYLREKIELENWNIDMKKKIENLNTRTDTKKSRNTMNRTKSETNFNDQKSLNRIKSEQYLLSDKFLPSWARDSTESNKNMQVQNRNTLNRTKSEKNFNYQKSLNRTKSEQYLLSDKFLPSWARDSTDSNKNIPVQKTEKSLEEVQNEELVKYGIRNKIRNKYGKRTKYYSKPCHIEDYTDQTQGNNNTIIEENESQETIENNNRNDQQNISTNPDVLENKNNPKEKDHIIQEEFEEVDDNSTNVSDTERDEFNGHSPIIKQMENYNQNNIQTMQRDDSNREPKTEIF
jgi:hypothetical protein